MANILDIERRRETPTKFTIMIKLGTYEELEEACKLLGTSPDKMVVKLIEEFIKGMKEEGYDLTPAYIKKLSK